MSSLDEAIKASERAGRLQMLGAELGVRRNAAAIIRQQCDTIQAQISGAKLELTRCPAELAAKREELETQIVNSMASGGETTPRFSSELAATLAAEGCWPRRQKVLNAELEKFQKQLAPILGELKAADASVAEVERMLEKAAK